MKNVFIVNIKINLKKKVIKNKLIRNTRNIKNKTQRMK